MPPNLRNRNWQDVLRYRPQRGSQATIARYYAKWRNEEGLPRRCDNQLCVFNVEKLVWNEKPLPLILDHLDGNNKDNRPEKLRYLCPNCDAQLTTRGGGNKRRVEQALEDRFTLWHRDGTRRHELFIREELSIAESPPSVEKRRG
jgi:hypothetical protein